MSDYGELVKALRCCAENYGCPIECPRHAPIDEGIRACVSRLQMDAAAAIEELQAEVKRLKECNDELREAQTYIDHYGDKWLTSAKDVPTSAYNHGYMDGKNEAEQALEPKRGEWIDGDGRRVTAICSVCGHLRLGNGAEYANKSVHFCENCGSKMGGQNDEP